MQNEPGNNGTCPAKNKKLTIRRAVKTTNMSPNPESGLTIKSIGERRYSNLKNNSSIYSINSDLEDVIPVNNLIINNKIN